MKKMATAAQTTRQNNISSQRSTNFRRKELRRPGVVRSGSTSFMTCSACCLMIVYEKPFVGRESIKTMVLDMNRNLRDARPFNAGSLGFWIVPFGARLCSEWEQYMSYRQQSWIFLRKLTEYYRAAMSQPRSDGGILPSFHPSQGTR
jgi:hypothetical protein